METPATPLTTSSTPRDAAANPGHYSPPKRAIEERKDFKHKLPELLWTERLIRNFPNMIDARTECLLPWKQHELPVYSLTLGSRQKDAPSVLLTGGVHGLERIGSQVILSWLQTFLERSIWDEHIHQLLEKVQIVVIPMVNPIGIYRKTRSNGNDIDLNRNAPIEAEGRVPFIGGGHRISPRIPCYRGKPDNPLELENRILEKILQRQIFNRPISIALDLHSGLGMRDHLWFPYAYRKKPIGSVANFLALKFLWEKTYPNQPYIYEPQSLHYLSHGDIWDYFYKQSKQFSQRCFLPLTLEMGSWNWVRKNPLQLRRISGIFNPHIAHRHSRVLRRHITLLDFILAATVNHKNWLPEGEQVKVLKQAAKTIWYS